MVSRLLTVLVAVIATYIAILSTHDVTSKNPIVTFVHDVILHKYSNQKPRPPITRPLPGNAAAAASLCDATCNNVSFPPTYPTYKPVSAWGSNGTYVPNLPGWTGPLPTPMYSGFVNVSGRPELRGSSTFVAMHYTVFEAMNGLELLDNSPVFAWLSGGPGAPSSEALFTEMGPLIIDDSGLGTPRYVSDSAPQLRFNNHTWSKLGTLIAFDAPPPVGFSFCLPELDHHQKLSECGVWNDTRAGLAHIEALRVLLTTVFPTLLRDRPLFLLTESWGGVYASAMADYLVNDPSFSGLRRNFAGSAVGDACMGTNQICNQIGPFTPWSPYPGPYYWLLFQYGHGQVSNADWDLLNSQCTVDELKNNYTVNCQDTLNNIRAKIGRFWIYDVYDECAWVGDFRSISTTTPDPFPANLPADRAPYFKTGYPCTFTSPTVFGQWINRTDVRTALGISQYAYFASDDGDDPGWYISPGTMQDGFQYWDPVNGALNQIPGMLYQPRLMSYNGDTDPAINVFFTQDKWLEFSRNYSIPQTKSWYAWLSGADPAMEVAPVGGHLIRFQNDLLTFATIRGSGHMVPTFRPQTAFVLMQAFVSNTLDSLREAPADPYA